MIPLAVRRCLTRGWVLLIIALACSRPALAQNKGQIYQQGVDALYSLDFAVAEERFTQLTKLEPDNPNNWNYLASAMWLKILASQEKLNMESFSGASIGTESSGEAVPKEVEKKLRDTIKTAIEKADAILNKKETRNDYRALYAKGVSKGTLAAFEALAKKSYFAAVSNASEAKDLHQKVLKQQPDFVDAKLSIGVYKYAVGAIPLALRVILFLSGGDKPGGIADITEVAKNNGAASTDAKMLLVVLYNREKQYEKSLETLTELHKRYPRNYMLELSGAAVHQRMGNYDLARTTYRRVIEKIETRRDGYERLEAPKVMLLLARVTMEGEHQSLPEARRIWNAVITDPRSTDTDRANAHLWLGKYLDNEGKHKEATDHYDAVLKPGLQVAQGVKDEATKYKKTPFKY